MLILGKDTFKDPSLGYARTFVKQAEDALGLALERDVKVVVNAGGINPRGLADKLREVATGLGPRSQDRARRGRRPPRPGGGSRPGARDLRQPADRQRLPRRVRHRRRLEPGRRRRRHRPGDRCVGRGRTGDRPLRLDARVVRRAGGRGRRRPRHRVRHPGHRRQLQRLPRPDLDRRDHRWTAARLPDRGAGRGRLDGDHQARRHRGRGHGRHRHRPARLRDPVDPLPQPRRDRRPHLARSRAGRPSQRRPGGRHRCHRLGAAGAAQGLPQLLRRLPQLRRVRGHRPRRRREGRVDQGPGRGRAREQ